MREELKTKIAEAPHLPGVYRFLGVGDEVIYVGKAKDLRKRLASYANGGDGRPQLPYLLADAVAVDWTVVTTELESAMLENTTIKDLVPKYNIELRDDKNYAFVTIDYSYEIPQIGFLRKFDTTRKQVRYFGPYSAAYKVKETLKRLRNVFPYCAAEKVGVRPCFYYYLHRCPGVCIGKVSLEEYRKSLGRIESCLRGDTATVKKQLKTEMKTAASKKMFELAGRIRDQLRSLEIVEERQSVILNKPVDWDVLGVSTQDGYACVVVMQVRNGKLNDRENFVFDLRDSQFPGLPEIMERFSSRYYVETSNLPREVFLSVSTGNEAALADLLRERAGKKVPASAPVRGKAKELAKLAEQNAAEHLKHYLGGKAMEADRLKTALSDLKEALSLPRFPRRIECFDNSHIQGTNTVSSMVVFEDGAPKKSEYRKFKIEGSGNTAGAGDDFASMREVLSRRLSRLPEVVTDGRTTWPAPDLIIIDGGKGQLSAAMEVYEQLRLQHPNLSIPMVGMAKRIEELFLPGNPNPVLLPHSHPALQMLQRLRDEAHRFGITFHRDLRSKQAIRSKLDEIPGVGPLMKKKLKAKFGSVKNMKAASSEELAAVVGPKLAATLKAQL